MGSEMCIRDRYMEDWGLMTGLSGIGTALIAKERELIDLLCLM